MRPRFSSRNSTLENFFFCAVLWNGQKFSLCSESGRIVLVTAFCVLLVRGVLCLHTVCFGLLEIRNNDRNVKVVLFLSRTHFKMEKEDSLFCQ